MEVPELETKFHTTLNNDAKEDSPDIACWEDDFNPLGLLDLVYVDDEEEKNKGCENDTELSTSTSNGLIDQQLTNTNSDDSDEDEQILEPFAAVDVLPTREEDFLPEGLTQETMEPCRTTWVIPRVSDADVTYHQWSFQDNGALQATMGIPPLIWTLPNPIQSSKQTSQHQLHEFQSQIPGGNFTPSISWKPSSSQDQIKSAGQTNSYQRFRERNRELVRIRNREYARRYRETHAERVRQRQRDYIKRYRERKKLQQEQAGLINHGNEQHSAHSVFENGILAAVLLNDGESVQDKVAQTHPEEACGLTPNITEQSLEDNDQSEIVVLS